MTRCTVTTPFTVSTVATLLLSLVEGLAHNKHSFICWIHFNGIKKQPSQLQVGLSEARACVWTAGGLESACSNEMG